MISSSSIPVSADDLPSTLSPTPSITTTPERVLATLVRREEVAPRHFLFGIRAPLIAAQARAGQFLHVLPRGATSSDPFLRRAFSIMGVQDEEATFLFRVEGRGTQQLSAAQVGEPLDVLGPLGKPFDVSPLDVSPFDVSLFHVKQVARTPILVGGGIGVPPLVFLARTLVDSGLKPVVLVGARSTSEVVGEAPFEALGVSAQISTDDGSRGERGYVTQRLDALLQTMDAPNEAGAVIYACGPMPMLRAVAQVAARWNVLCQVSLEENMPCGIGVCNGCVVPTHGAPSDYERFRRVCVHGPAMWASEVDWEAT